MTYVNTDTFFISTMTQHCLGIGTYDAKESITSPQGLIEIIINFFTFGAVRRERLALYEELEDCFAHALAESMANSVEEESGEAAFSPLPDQFTFKYQGYTLLFLVPGVTEPMYGHVMVSVFKPKEGEAWVRQFGLEQETFTRIATLALLRYKYPEYHLPDYLHEDGTVDIGDVNPAALDLRNLDTNGFKFSRRDENGNLMGNAYQGQTTCL